MYYLRKLDQRAPTVKGPALTLWTSTRATIRSSCEVSYADLDRCSDLQFVIGASVRLAHIRTLKQVLHVNGHR